MNNVIDDWSDIAKDIIKLRLPNYFEKILLTTNSKWGVSVPFEQFELKVCFYQGFTVTIVFCVLVLI